MQIDVRLNRSEKNYKVYVNELDKIEHKGKIAIVTNPKVSGLHLKSLLENIVCDECFVVSVPDGEQYKNLQTCENILEQLFISKLDRSSMLISFGGGVVGDITGFVASIYQRGIKFINIPTTLLSQVDASVGGKTGVNNKFGKNLIGSFYQPEAVYCETKFLKTLPQREFSAGFAEVVKMAVMFDKDFFDFMQDNDVKDKNILVEIIQKAIKLKADIVMQDEKELGVRALLNYGHTFAHVIENETKYSVYLHGEAVAIGINMANELSLKLGLITQDEKNKISNLLVKLNLPISYKIENIDRFYNAFFLDKKSQNNSIKFILSSGIGKNIIKSDVDKELICEVLSEFR
ncbi:3-dehydroquinate synthase [Campylobacter pinnipediorum]|uniref:3-dehydroquinate synthase n=1 Tax=Campylobacter pinnipediorum TaxID=1965231 RepID=UPI00084D92C3|nr:3-dehydroquinate synthase [Campylobacter pinnipediorum]AQW84316.1 3-dehydroquinate synthase [Campylobacter pinnipediorum subsp. pinnipediorum]